MSEKWLSWRTEGHEVDRPVVDFNGRWRNDLGSEMEIQIGQDGAVTGEYRTAVGAPGRYEKFRLTGSVNGDLIAFVANWEKYGSLTAWTGQHAADDTGEERILTVWHLMKNVDERSEAANLWGATLIGSNVFRRVPAEGAQKSE